MKVFDYISLYYRLKKLEKIIKEVGLMKFLEGYRTYLTLIVLIIHQIIKLLGLDPVEDEKLTVMVDTFLLILAGIFRKLAKPKKEDEK